MNLILKYERNLMLGAVALLMLVSLISSLSLRTGHADAPIAATADEVEPLAVGDNAPRFKVRAVNGDAVDFNPTQLQRPVVLVTFRGGWCPYCNMHLSELRHVIPEIRDAGIDVLFLSGDRPELLYRSLSLDTQQDIEGRDYEILSDADANAAIALGIAFRASDRVIARLDELGRDVEGSSISRHTVLPVPAVFAIGTDGVIAFAHVDGNYKERLAAPELRDVALSLVATTD